MRIYQILQPEFNDFQQLVGLFDLNIFDMSEVMSPNMDHDDIFNFFQETIMLMATGPGADLANVNIDEPVGLSCHPDAFPNLQAIITAGGYTQGARHRIRNILGFNVMITREPHGYFAISHIKIYLHCDYEIT